MSQWGAYGYALHGWSYDADPRALLPRHDARARRRRRSCACCSPRRRPDVALGSRRAVAASSTARRRRSRCRPARSTLARIAHGRRDRRSSRRSPSRRAARPSRSAGAPYRGKLVVTSDGKPLQVVNVVALEPYLDGRRRRRGAVDLAAAALEAQAVAARSYALAKLRTVAAASAFDLYTDTRSQVYGGIAAETPARRRRSTATAGQVVLYRGKVATTLLLVELRRRDGLGRRGDGHAGPVPRRRSPTRTTRSRRTTTGARSLLERRRRRRRRSALHGRCRPADDRSVEARVDRDRGRPDDSATLTGSQSARDSVCARRGSGRLARRSSRRRRRSSTAATSRSTGIARGPPASTLEAKRRSAPGSASSAVASTRRASRVDVSPSATPVPARVGTTARRRCRSPSRAVDAAVEVGAVHRHRDARAATTRYRLAQRPAARAGGRLDARSGSRPP